MRILPRRIVPLWMRGLGGRKRAPGARRWPALALGAAIGASAGAGAAVAQEGYDFASPPSADANRVYGVNARTGEVSACQFERPEGSTVGITRCFAQGEGAGTQKPGAYALVPTRYTGETGIFRVNRETGEMSICYVRELPRSDGSLESTILCTAPAK